MKVTNNIKQKSILIKANYHDTHYLSEALKCYQFKMEKEYGKNSEEEKYIGELLSSVRNPNIT